MSTDESNFRLDLLTPDWVKPIVRSPLFPIAFQMLALAGMVALLVNGWGLGPGLTSGEISILRKTNLTTLAVWGLWWPLMILGTLAAG
ncbi:MAG: hypothetical protein COV48_10855 [Elusimicrobia bacterium CG11_big_fil_rev_8_21_14_0_20_64_6]|nr:MAG: hypothetical protein COV48_10855 [Elusimicrobia bacterium CG11_big_fil_rev_8_21_14_0_20_64_6]